MSDVFIYSVQRLGLFVAALVVFGLLGARGVLAVILAALTSLGLSYVLLGRQREAVATRVAQRIDRRLGAAPGPAGRQADADTAAEDAADDALRGRSATVTHSVDDASDERGDAAPSSPRDGEPDPQQ